MARFVDRRTFLKRGGAAALGIIGAPLLASSRAAAAGERLVVAVGQSGIETPFAWRTSQSEKCLWDQTYDSLITRDPKTFTYRPGLATEWKPLNEMRTWTFKLRSGVPFHEGRGEMTAEDVKFTVEQNLKPDAQGGMAPTCAPNLDRIETPDKLTVVMHFKTRLWDVPSQFSRVRGLPEHHLEEVPRVGGRGEGIIPSDRHWALPPRRGQAGRLPSASRRVPNHWRKTPDFKELVIRRLPRSRHADGGPPRGRDRHRAGVRRLSRPGRRRRACGSTRRRTPLPTG